MTEAAASSEMRAAQAYAWARDSLGLTEAGFAPASADASFRRYFRVTAGQRSWIVMDAPPEREDCRPFLRVAELMRAAGLHVPVVFAQDLDRGFLLLSDLGTRTYLEVLNAENASTLFDDAIRSLILWQRASRPDQLPAYDTALLQRELALFPDWYLREHAHWELSEVERARLQRVFDLLIQSALRQPRVYVHRDFMPRNLMQSAPNPGVLDFQDAVYGPLTYDLVCLFKDAFISWAPEQIEQGIGRYRSEAQAAGLDLPDPAEFRRAFDWMGVQRHLKVLGIFARIRYRDGKPHYLTDTPRFVRYLRDVLARYPELDALSEFLDRAERLIGAGACASP